MEGPDAKRVKLEDEATRFARVLDSMADNDMMSQRTGVWKLRTKTVYQQEGGELIVDKLAFFMKKQDAIRFRHEGLAYKIPNVVYLPAMIENGSLTYETAPSAESRRVPVYFSASGSGKTVELAVSTVTHHAHLALLLAFDESEDLKQEEVMDYISKHPDEGKDYNVTRTKLASRKIRDAILGISGGWGNLKTILKAQPKNGLKLVVGIDEASACPTIVRSILSNVEGTEKWLKNGLYDSLVQLASLDGAKIEPGEAHKLVKDISFGFAIAGTGVASSTLGSSEKTFQHLPTSAMARPYLYPQMALQEAKINIWLPGEFESSCITISNIKEKLPILHCMMENARMASIALSKLDTLRGRNIVEKHVVNSVCKVFIESNGLQSIQKDSQAKNAVGACSLAVLLFQHQTPDFNRQEDKDTYFRSYECGIKFDISVVNTFLKSKRTATNDERMQFEARKKLVATFGLLEPNVDDTTSTPFRMRPSQQLIALSLLGVQLSQLVQSDPFGFEVLSTHTMKAALAASSAVNWEDRKSVKETLETVGCMVDAATQQKTKAEWEGLQSFFVVRHMFKEKANVRDSEEDNAIRREKRKGTPTRILNAELWVSSRMITSHGGEKKKKKVLYIEKGYREDLSDSIPQTQQDPIFHPPIAAVNYGGSDLADGNITCFMAQKNWVLEAGLTDGDMTWNTQPVKFTAMNQAKDKLGYTGTPKGPLPLAKLKTHAKRCGDPVLNGLFGEKRVLFVSTPTDMRTKGQAKANRPWLPRTMNPSNCKILAGLMNTLHSQRSQIGRQKTFTDCVDETGAIIVEPNETDDDKTDDGLDDDDVTMM